VPHQTLHGLNHLRTLAILLVFMFHYLVLVHEPSWISDVAAFMWTGVDLFFVLSGFLIASQLFAQVKNDQRISFRQFFLKRFFRIIPAYWVTLAIYFCIPFFHEKEALPPLWKFLTFTHNLSVNLNGSGTFSHAWSLCVEEHFYFFLPLILILLQSLKVVSKSWWLLIALFAFGFFIRHYSFEHLYMPHIEEERGWAFWYRYIYYPTWSRLDGLLAGVSIAAVYTFRPFTWSRISQYGNQILVLGLLVLTGAYFLCEDQTTHEATVFGFPLVAIGYGCLVIGAVSPACFLYKWNSRTTAFIATLSYAIYLTHKGVIHMTHVLLGDLQVDSNIMLIICMLTCIGGALLLHYAVERPFMQLRKRFVRSKQ